MNFAFVALGTRDFFVVASSFCLSRANRCLERARSPLSGGWFGPGARLADWWRIGPVVVGNRSGILAVTMQCNHRWTQIDTDRKSLEAYLSTEAIRSPFGDLEHGAEELESGQQHLCSSVSICGFPLHGYGLEGPVRV